MTQAEAVRRWRDRHPDRARIVRAQVAARQRAMVRLGERHAEELEALVVEECKARDIPRFLSPMPRNKDLRFATTRAKGKP